MIRKSFVIFIVSFNVILASGGSIYSKFGLGDMKYSYSARGFAMGEAGIALSNSDYVGLYNPASWDRIQLVKFEIGVSFKGYDVSSEQNSAFTAETDFGGFTLAFPISTAHGISLVGGLTPYSNIQYDVIEKVQSDQAADYTLEYSGQGGLSKAFIGLSYRLPFDLSVGASYEFLTGKTENVYSIEFESDTDFKNSTYRIDLKNRGSAFTFGLISPDLSSLFGIDNLSKLRFGLTYNYIPNMSTDSVLTAENPVGVTEFKNKTIETEIPSRIGAGLSLLWNENYTLLFDYLYQPFSEFAENGVKSDNLRDLQRVSAGFEFRHESGRFGTTWEQIRWRAGLSYEQTPYVIRGKGINEMAVYAGFSYPLAFESSLDIGLKYGMRGTTDLNLVKENIFELYISVSFGDIWFRGIER